MENSKNMNDEDGIHVVGKLAVEIKKKDENDENKTRGHPRM